MAAPHPASPHAPPQQGNGLAVAGMVLGILGLVLCFIAFVGGICALVGVILSGIGLAKAGKIGGKGKGMAIAGLVCGILGIVAQIVVVFVVMASFNQYMKKSKLSEAKLQLRSIETKAKTFYNMKQTFPPTASAMPSTASPDCIYPKQPQSAWEAAGWRDLGFHVDEDSRCQYSWTSRGNSATAEARCDADCDGTPEVYVLELEAIAGNPTATYIDPP